MEGPRLFRRLPIATTLLAHHRLAGSHPLEVLMQPTTNWTRSRLVALAAIMVAVGTTACTEATSTGPMPRSVAAFSAQPWGPETPHFNDELILRPPGGGGAQGQVKFRQPNDDALRINLDVAVRGLAPNTHYQL